jgi:hypothetical protein
MERAEAKGQSMATSVDRAYETGVRYLVLPWHFRGQVMRDNACSSTQPYTAKLASHAPPGATPAPDKSNAGTASSESIPTASQEDGLQAWQGVLAAALGIAILAALALMLARRSRRPRPSS